MKWRLAGIEPGCAVATTQAVAISAATFIIAMIAPVLAQTDKRPMVWDADTEYIGKVTFQTSTTTNDTRYSNTIALRAIDGVLVAYSATNDQSINEWKLPYTDGKLTSTQATLRRNVGRCQLVTNGALRGLYWDVISDDAHDGHLYCTSAHNYDTDPAIAPVLSRSYIDADTGKLVSEGQWTFQRLTYPYAPTTDRGSGSDKGMMGNVVPVPDWFVARHPGFGRLAGTAPGAASAVATGPAFMTTGIAAFTPPVTGSTDLVVARSILGHPYTPDPASGTDRVWRNTLYHNDYGDKWPRDPVGDHGFAVWGDQALMVWVDTPSISSPVSFETWNEGRAWYGANTTPPTDGYSAQLNSEFGGFYVRTYDIALLDAVAFGGIRQDKVQGVWSPLRIPGVPYPISETAKYPGSPSGRQYMPGMPWRLNGAAFEPTYAVIALLVRPPISTTNRVAVHLFRVRENTMPPPPKPTGLTLQESR